MCLWGQGKAERTPASMVIWVWAAEATWRSWVASKTAPPCFVKACNFSMTIWALAASRLPVGSSARRREG